MECNVFINVYLNGALLYSRVGHNIWVDEGRQYLANLVGFADFDLETTLEDDRVRYIGFGIGGKKQADLPLANNPPISDAYPAGADPNATTGNEYDTEFPDVPRIGTLERPVRITGDSDPYPGDPSDVWLVAPSEPQFMTFKVPREPAQTTEGSVDLVGSFPGAGVLNGKTLILKVTTIGTLRDEAGILDQTVTFSSPANASDVLTQINAQILGAVASLGGANGLVLTSNAGGVEVKIKVVGGTALSDLGMSPETVSGVASKSIIFRGMVDTATDILPLGGPNGPFMEMPLSEVGLFLSSADINNDYNEGMMAAYHLFVTIPLTPGGTLDLIWQVNFWCGLERP